MSKASHNTPITARSLSRRQIAGFAAVGALTAAAGMTGKAAASASDPILAAIEAHRTAWMKWSETVFAEDDVQVEFGMASAECRAAEKANADGYNAELKAAIALAQVRPTTLAGVVALLAYVDEYNRGHMNIPGQDPFNYASTVILWPEELTAEEVTGQDIPTMNARPLKMPFPFWIMRNVQAALQNIAV